MLSSCLSGSTGATLFQASSWLSCGQGKRRQMHVRPGKYVIPHFIKISTHFTQRTSLRVTIYVISKMINWPEYISFPIYEISSPDDYQKVMDEN